MPDNPRNLPILRTEATQVFCEICPEPGHCCKGFTFQKSFWKDEGLDAAQQVLTEGDVPFIIERWAGYDWTTKEGRAYDWVVCSCPKLEEDGRCGIYLDRPGTCRNYAAGSDPLCVFSGTSGINFDWSKYERPE